MDSTAKIEKDTHYNVIVMSDDGDAKTYRMRKGFFRFFIMLPFLMLLLGGSIIAGGVYFSKYYFTLRAERDKQDKEISEMRLQLERLTNLETLLSARSGGTPLAKHEEIGVTPPPAENPAAQPHESMAAQNATSAQASPTGEPEPTELAPEMHNLDAALAETDPAVEPSQTAAAPLPDLDFNSMEKLSGNKSPLRIVGFTARTLGQQRVRIRYDLNTSGRAGGKAVAGLARHFAVFQDGKRAELPLPDNGETRFTITRMKPMEATARLPQGFDTKDIKQIDVVIVTDNLGTFHDLFDVTNWRSY